ncbi:MAG: hypothetical protein ACXAC2_16710, partial [Candidatus Kariarchaeaceae archaeon]
NIGVIKTLLGDLDIGQDPGMFIWLLIMLNILMFIIPVFGIFLGVRILPFNEKDGKELIFSTKKSPIWYFIENFIIVMALIPLIILPMYLIGFGFLLSTIEYVDSLAIAMFLPTFFVMVVAMVTALGASIKSSSRVGYAFGGIFYIISFTLSLLSAEISFAKDINLMSQMDTFQHALAGTWNIRYILTCLSIVGILAVLTIIFLYRTDYIESRTSYSQKIKGVAGLDLKSNLSILRRPLEPFLSKVGWKYPAFRDQLQSSASTFLIYGFISAMLFFIVLIVYPGDAAMNVVFTEMSSIIDNPLVAAFMFGHNATPTLEGFLIFKLMTFHWIYYGPFIFIATYSIIMRDKSDGYDEITWSLPRKRSRVIIQRTTAMLVYLWIIIAFNWIAFWIGELTLSTFADVVAPDFISTIIAFSFLGLGYSLFLIVFVTIALIPNPKYIIITLVSIFMIAVFLPVIAFVNQDFSWISYLSPFQYFDVIGLLLNDVKIVEEAIPTIVAGGVVAIILYLSSVMLLTPRRDIV